VGQKNLASYSAVLLTLVAIVLDPVRKVLKKEEQEVVVDNVKKKGKGIFRKEKKETSNVALENWFYYTTLFELRSRLAQHITPVELTVHRVGRWRTEDEEEVGWREDGDWRTNMKMENGGGRRRKEEGGWRQELYEEKDLSCS
jgi:hypothetical protein